MPRTYGNDSEISAYHSISPYNKESFWAASQHLCLFDHGK